MGNKEVKIDITTRETIKPSSPTPQHRKYIKLSILDQLNFAMSTPLLLFYPLKCNTDNKNLVLHAIKEQSQILKSSLSKTLTLFYPLASNKLIKNNSCIECNDYGIEYIETKVNYSMLDLFQEPKNNILEKLIPIDINSENFTGAIIQANFFNHGGFAIGISLSHKIADAVSLGTFLNAWSATCLSMKSGETWTSAKVMLPHFIADTIIPSPDDSLLLPSPLPPPPAMAKCITRRYVFHSSKVSLLKTKIAAAANIQQPTRVEAVTSLLWKSLMSVSRLKSKGYSRKSVLIQAINLRKRFNPPLPENYIGNLSGKFLVTTKEEDDDDDIELSHLVTYLRERLKKVTDHVSKGVNGAIKMEEILEFAKEFGELHRRDDVDLYSFTSLCGFPFYKVDFGWGKPAWTIVTNLVLKNYMVMIDAKDGKGVEVWMSLGEEDVPLLEANQELLAFASINPSVN